MKARRSFKKKKTTPQSQSDKAREKVERAKERKEEKKLERAGDAILAGDPKKAKKLLDGKKPKQSKKQREASALTLVKDLRVKLHAIRMLDLDIECAKAKYASLKKDREKKNAELLQELGESGQGRLPFDQPEPRPKKDVEAAVHGASAKPEKSTDPVADAVNGPTQHEIDAAGKELDGLTKSPGDSIDAGTTDDGLPPPAARTQRSRDRRARTAVHEVTPAA